MKRYVVLDKNIGETPLQCAEAWRAVAGAEYADVPLAYAGRLDPMASGKLLVLIGEECKNQTSYHGLDKTYEFEVLFGVSSDSGDVLGLVSETTPATITETSLQSAATQLTGTVTLPYPKFSSKAVAGKPLHTWTLEGRLHEIEIPTYTAEIYALKLLSTREVPRQTVHTIAREKIDSLPPVTDPKKSIGNDFRRTDVHATWDTFKASVGPDSFTIAKFRCTCSSGTYMRTLAEEIAKLHHTGGLAFSIHRTQMGTYTSLPFRLGFWRKTFA